MFAIRRIVLSAALMLAVVMGSAAPAAAQGPGIWVYLRRGETMTITLINLADTPLMIVGNTIKAWVDLIWNRSAYQSHPFQVTNNGPLIVDPYGSATWKSFFPLNTDGDAAWDGYMVVTPLGWAPQWYLDVTCDKHWPKNATHNYGKGTWVYLRAYRDPEWGTLEFSDSMGYFYDAGWRYGIWSTLVPVDPIRPWPISNVMTASRPELAVSLYSSDNRDLIVVVRQTHWDGTKNDDYKGWKLEFVDNDDDSVPD